MRKQDVLNGSLDKEVFEMALSVVFKSGNSMAVRLLKECSLPKGTRIHEYRDGNRIIIEPLGKNDFPQSFLDSLGA